MPKVLMVDFEKCTGCRLCELVCAVSHDGISNPARSRIRVLKWEAEGLYIPMTCQQCQDAPCMAVCPMKAISRDEAMGLVSIDYNACIGCRSCIGACPFGAMSFHLKEKQVFKCDLCDGAPECVRVCEPKALTYVDGLELHQPRLRESARKHYQVMRNMAV